MRRLPSLFVAAGLAAGMAVPAFAVDKTYDTEEASIRVETVAGGLKHPWGLAFLPDGNMLVTERPGFLRIVTPEGKISEAIYGVPEVDARSQGGLLDVALDPDFEENRLVYLTYSEKGDTPEDKNKNGTAVARGHLTESMSPQLKDVEVIFRQQSKEASTNHFGSRLVFDREGHLFVTLGERQQEKFRGQAQDLSSHLGKIVRIMPDGSVPEDNPFVGKEGALPEIWSYGHRNPQGAALNPETGALWENEHGPRGGDEINIPEPGKNYGWPVVSNGVNYSGTPVGTGEKSAPGMEDPHYQWTPSIGASGMAFYTGDAIPEWKGNLFVGGLAIPSLRRLTLDGDEITAEEPLLEDLGLRIRDVRQGPDGALYLLTDDEEGQILRITKAE
ncbi:glucose sorbosone dehydrogenase [Parvibaculum lavamentivorans DS-1]|uniref:Glucose sorbosone dehydrogenase n=1 Tax=Parvibaculum lavamentivorans (strain DS-1 / DSM 13023 / NCIMB 13966) TaxID=402881 RepID=A7HR50_PARL1|nr:PQQ-dependent sugar dehydrogenase [Parvibaculum lavamentivorans]ABS62383.1 glucose sorbosone dehydrogenase [Parvibaculum lavamentivorans DS-1]